MIFDWDISKCSKKISIAILFRFRWEIKPRSCPCILSTNLRKKSSLHVNSRYLIWRKIVSIFYFVYIYFVLYKIFLLISYNFFQKLYTYIYSIYQKLYIYIFFSSKSSNEWKRDILFLGNIEILSSCGSDLICLVKQKSRFIKIILNNSRNGWRRSLSSRTWSLKESLSFSDRRCTKIE